MKTEMTSNAWWLHLPARTPSKFARRICARVDPVRSPPGDGPLSGSCWVPPPVDSALPESAAWCSDP